MASWKQLLLEEMANNEEIFKDIIFNTMSEEEMNQDFDNGYGGVEGCPFTVWTENFVYFPACYDGAEWVESVARNPNGKPTMHIGGG